MTVISNSETFVIADGSIIQEAVTITVLAVGAAGTGTGRLIHPTLGSYDYPHRPDEYTNLRGDVIIEPIWAHTTTLDSGRNTLWQGDIRDVVCREKWDGRGGLSMSAAMLDVLMGMYTNPPDPEDAVEANRYVEWWPSYATTNGYKVVLEAAGTGRGELKLTQVINQGWLEAPFELQLRIIDYA